jgi:uncharacterized membrane protein (DUF2068 family)
VASDRLVRVIGAFKLVKAATLLAISAGAFTHLRHDVARHLYALSSDHVREAVARLDGASEGQARKLGIAALAYAALFLVEGVGLLARKVWAEWLTIVITGSFIPIEIYELVEHRSVTKAIVIGLNVAVVIYLVVRRVHDTPPGRVPTRT